MRDRPRSPAGSVAARPAARRTAPASYGDPLVPPHDEADARRDKDRRREHVRQSGKAGRGDGRTVGDRAEQRGIRAIEDVAGTPEDEYSSESPCREAGA